MLPGPSCRWTRHRSMPVEAYRRSIPPLLGVAANTALDSDVAVGRATPSAIALRMKSRRVIRPCESRSLRWLISFIKFLPPRRINFCERAVRLCSRIT